MKQRQDRSALSTFDYDEQWSRLSDFIKYNPGARHRRRLIADAITRLPQASTVLEVGCGPGELIMDLKRLCPSARLSGLDLSTVAIEACRRAHPDVTFHVADIVESALDSSFDLVVCSEVTEHVDDPLRALRNMRAMTTDGGFLVLTTPHGRIHSTELAIGHVKHPTRSELTKWLQEAGFTVVRIRQWGWPGYTILKYVANLAPETALDHLGQGEYSKAMKRLNNIAFHLARWMSLPASPLGPQFVVTARAGS
jgi:2-polyprenyl-3-methyl-5-hydroxy-6-metoxy-1,4-benzoquinol methylase